MTLRLAFLGCGKVTRRHARTLRAIGADASLSFGSRVAAKSDLFRRELKGVAGYASYDAAINATETDVVVVATPPHLHLELVLAALAAGKHVIVEKPPFFHAADFDVVSHAAAAAERRVLVAENYFYKPLAVCLRRLVSERAVGDPVAVHLNALKVQRPSDWRADPAVSGGGALFEGGIHWVNLLNNLGLTVESASGWLRNRDPGRERTALVNVRYAEGAVGTLLHSWESPSRLFGLRMSRIYGTDGAIFFESHGLAVTVSGKRTAVLFPGVRDLSGSRAMWRDFLTSLASNRPARFSVEMAKRDLEVIESVYASVLTAPSYSRPLFHSSDRGAGA